MTVMVEIHEYAGLRRSFDVGLRLAPTSSSAASAAKSLAAILDEHPDVAVRLVDVDALGGRVGIVVAVCLGTIDDLKAATSTSRAALALLQRIVDDLSAYDPAFVQLPAVPRVVAGDRRGIEVEGLRHLSAIG